MNKKIVAIFIFIVVTIILLLLSYPNNVVTIELQRESISDTGATIIITDKGFQKHGWGAEYFLQAKENGEWKRLEPLSYIPNPDSIFPLFDYSLNEHDQLMQTLDWSIRYGELQNGTYRIVKIGFDPKTDEEVYFYSEEFEIK